MFQYWKEYHIDVPSGYSSYNLSANTSNVLKIINSMKGGVPIYASTYHVVTEDFYELKIDPASASSIVQPERLGTVHFFNPSSSPYRIRVQEIQTDDIAYMFNATNSIQITGALETTGLKKSDLNLNANKSLGVFIQDATLMTKLDTMIALLTDIKNKP